MIGYTEVLVIILAALISSYFTGFYIGGQNLSTPIQTIKKGIDISYSRIFGSLLGIRDSAMQRSVGGALANFALILPSLTLSIGLTFFFSKTLNLSEIWSAIVFSLIFFGGAITMFGLDAFKNAYLPSPQLGNLTNQLGNLTQNNSTGGYILQ